MLSTHAMVRTIILIFTLSLACAASADAYSYPNERPDARLDKQTRLAIEWWAAQGVTGCPDGIVARVADDLDEGTIGRGGDCRIWVVPYALDNYTGQLCTLARHEVGHALGLRGTLRWDDASGQWIGDAHADKARYPVMDPNGPIMDDCIPYSTKQRGLRWAASDRRLKRSRQTSIAARRAESRGRKHLRKGSPRSEIFYCGVLP